jgi:uncharacterized protein (TIGR02145 family)
MKTRLLMSVVFIVLFFINAFAQHKKNEIVRDSILDSRDQKIYKMVKIGNVTWMTENLKWECDGSFIYEDLPKNLKKYGRLYSYEASQNACPAGTRLPTKQDWDSLKYYADPKDAGDAGEKLLKKTKPGFAATIGGYKNAKGKYVELEEEGQFWGADNTVYFTGQMKDVTFKINDAIQKKDFKNCYSIRCVKN